MTREQLDAIRARVEAAKTEEGWEPVHQIHKESYVDETHTGFQACGPIVFCGKYSERSADEANELSYAHMDLIENAPADILALLAEVERLTAERDDVNRVAQDILRDEGHPNYLNHGAAYTMGLLETRLKDARAKHMFSNGGTDDSP